MLCSSHKNKRSNILSPRLLPRSLPGDGTGQPQPPACLANSRRRGPTVGSSHVSCAFPTILFAELPELIIGATQVEEWICSGGLQARCYLEVFGCIFVAPGIAVHHPKRVVGRRRRLEHQAVAVHAQRQGAVLLLERQSQINAADPTLLLPGYIGRGGRA